MKNKKEDRWTVENSFAAVEKMLNRHGWHLVPKKKTGSGVIIHMTTSIIKEEYKQDERE